MGKTKELFILYETAAGYCLCRVKEFDVVAMGTAAIQTALADRNKFSQIVVQCGFVPFASSEEAIANMNAIVAGEVTPMLKDFLADNLPKKLKKVSLGVSEAGLSRTLHTLGFPVVTNDAVLEILRYCRTHTIELIPSLSPTSWKNFQVGLGHGYTRTKMQVDPRRQDKPVQQAIALIDILDKSINTFAMRVKEWYGWHFPELAKIVTDNYVYAQLCRVIKAKEDFDMTDSKNRKKLLKILNGSEELLAQIEMARNVSLGANIADADMDNIKQFAAQVIRLSQQRKTLTDYLEGRLNLVAPNLSTLVGDTLAARLISHAGSLVNLAKCPASTIQILGAEKALFRALKTKGKTPKYGLLFQSSFIGRVQQKNRGRISRYLANKCALAARIDSFSEEKENSSNVFGTKMRDQVEERLKYLAEGTVPRKNLEVMREACIEAGV